MARGNNRADIFLDDADRRLFLDLLKRSVERFELELFCFCLMGNHYHLFLRTPQANLSRAMHWLNASYASRFKFRHGYSGHVFQGRYKSVLVTADSHWLHLSMYIHLNPVRAGLADDPAQHEWSSFRDYTRSKPRYRWLSAGRVLRLYGKGEAERRRRYRRACLTLSGKPPDFWEKFRSDVVLGSREVLEELAKKYAPDGDTKTVPDFTMAGKADVDLDFELERVADAFGVEVEELMRRRRNFAPRLAAYYHLVENCGVSVTETASLFGISGTAVSLGVRKILGSGLKFKVKGDVDKLRTMNLYKD
jgi:REP element-mobilizing transposase RayT